MFFGSAPSLSLVLAQKQIRLACPIWLKSVLVEACYIAIRDKRRGQFVVDAKEESIAPLGRFFFKRFFFLLVVEAKRDFYTRMVCICMYIHTCCCCAVYEAAHIIASTTEEVTYLLVIALYPPRIFRSSQARVGCVCAACPCSVVVLSRRAASLS